MKKRSLFSMLISGSIGFVFLFNKLAAIRSLMGVDLPMKNAHYYAWRFGNVYYTKVGKGKPLLLIHELNPCSSAEEWSELIHSLSIDHTVYALDLPGCGRSDKPDVLYTQFLYDQMLVSFVKDVIQEKTDVIATGYSYPIAVMTNRLDPEVFDRIIGINPTPAERTSFTPGLQNRLMRMLLQTPFVGTFIYNLFHSKYFVTNDLVNNAFYDPTKLKPETADLYYRFAHYDHKQNRCLFASMLNHYLNLDIRDALGDLDCISIIVGSEDKQAEQTLYSYNRYAKQIKIEVIEETAHLPQLERPFLLNSAIRKQLL